MGYKINGNSVLSTSAPADSVYVWVYTTGAYVTIKTPDALGDWEANGLDIAKTYGVTSIGPSGYQPISHGPITPVSNGFTEAILNPSDKGSNCALSLGNLRATFSGGGMVRSDLSKTSGKWYWEVTATSATNNMVIGVAGTSASVSQYTGQNTDSWGYYGNGGILHNGSGSGSQAAYSIGDIIGVALDAGAGTVQFYKNGVSTGSLVTGLPATVYASNGAGNPGVDMTTNFGTSPLTYLPPSGFNAGLYV